MSRSPSARAEGLKSGRHVEHVSEACMTCRTRKLKCDKENPKERSKDKDRPPCQRCVRDGRLCVWSTKGDGRGAITKDLVISQQNRIQALEGHISRLERELRLEKAKGVNQITPDDGTAPMPTRPASFDQLSNLPHYQLVFEEGCMKQYGMTSPFNWPLEKPLEMCRKVSPPRTPPHSVATGRFAGNVDWSRYLPLDKVPLTREQHDQLLDWFFKYFASWNACSLRKLFERDMHEVLSNNSNLRPHYSGMLHNAILAIATAYSDDTNLSSIETRMIFARKAEEYMSEEFQRPSLSGVQAMAHLASFYTGLSDNTGFIYFGICARMSQTLGLAVDPTQLVQEGRMTEQDMLDRVWLYWTTFSQDKSLSIYLGREISIPKSLTVKPPVLPEELRSEKGDFFAEYVKLFAHAADMVDVIYSRASPTRDAVTKLSLCLDEWFNQLPHSMRVMRPTSSTSACPDSLMLRMIFDWLVIHLYRPFYRASPTSSHGVPLADTAVKRCDQSATKILQLLDCYSRLYGLRCVPMTAVQIAFVAGTIFVYKAERLQENSSERQTTALQVKKCIDMLREMEQTWKCAGRTRMILEDILRGSTVSSVMNKVQQPAVESPIDIKDEMDWAPGVADSLPAIVQDSALGTPHPPSDALVPIPTAQPSTSTCLAPRSDYTDYLYTNCTGQPNSTEDSLSQDAGYSLPFGSSPTENTLRHPSLMHLPPLFNVPAFHYNVQQPSFSLASEPAHINIPWRHLNGYMNNTKSAALDSFSWDSGLGNAGGSARGGTSSPWNQARISQQGSKHLPGRSESPRQRSDPSQGLRRCT